MAIHKLGRYLISLVIVFPLLFTTVSGGHVLYYKYVPIEWLGQYYAIRPQSKVLAGESFWLLSDAEIHVSAPATWFDSLLCKGQLTDYQYHRLGPPQVWPGLVKSGERRWSDPWRFVKQAPPEWAEACKIKGQLCFSLLFYITRCVEYESEPFKVYTTSTIRD